MNSVRSEYYYVKYLKYKNKYLKLKKQIGGNPHDNIINKYIELNPMVTYFGVGCGHNSEQEMPTHILKNYPPEYSKLFIYFDSDFETPLKAFKKINCEPETIGDGIYYCRSFNSTFIIKNTFFNLNTPNDHILLKFLIENVNSRIDSHLYIADSSAGGAFWRPDNYMEQLIENRNINTSKIRYYNTLGEEGCSTSYKTIFFVDNMTHEIIISEQLNLTDYVFKMDIKDRDIIKEPFTDDILYLAYKFKEFNKKFTEKYNSLFKPLPFIPNIVELHDFITELCTIYSILIGLGYEPLEFIEKLIENDLCTTAIYSLDVASYDIIKQKAIIYKKFIYAVCDLYIDITQSCMRRDYLF
jgi:hypothetical protein